MRIRKRPVPFLLPAAVSDPLLNLNRSPPASSLVQLDQNDAFSPPQPEWRPIGCDSIVSDEEDKIEKRARLEFLFEDQEGREKGNDMRNENISSAQTVSGFHHKSSPKYSSSSQALVPPKKRSRGNNNIISNTTGFDRDRNMNAKPPKTSTIRSAKKCGKNDDVLNVHRDRETEGSSGAAKRKAAGRGGALMEGSRCSRVNGRGWRCCQQTLVGYSLCEHHLGKGRLRSMTSVRSRSLTSHATTATALGSTSTRESLAEADTAVRGSYNNDTGVDDSVGEGRDCDNGLKMKSNGRKRMKLGMVKARSISSLLGQASTDNSNGAISMVDRDQYSS